MLTVVSLGDNKTRYHKTVTGLQRNEMLSKIITKYAQIQNSQNYSKQ